MSAFGPSLRRRPLHGLEDRYGLPRNLRRLILCLSLLLMLPMGCDSGSQPVASEAAAIEKRYEEGALAVIARVGRDEITVADRVELTLTAISAEDQQVRFPEFQDGSLGEFRVVRSRNTAPKLLDDGRLQTQRIYELEPFLPGEYSIPPMAVVFRGSSDDEPGEQTIETDSMAVKVRSVLSPSEEEPDIIETSGPVDLPGVDPWVYWLAAGSVLLAALAGFLFWRKRRAKARFDEAPPLPHEVAYRELDKLLAEDLIRKGQAKLFYLRVSNILRRYIEERFGLRAPERTTEEFLVDLRGSDELERRHQDLLKTFLEHCDLVKFAGHRPSDEEIERTVHTCKQFIVETEPRVVAESKPVALAQ